MWERYVLKDRAKNAFQRNYWRSVLVAFILLLLVGGTGTSVRRQFDEDYPDNYSITRHYNFAPSAVSDSHAWDNSSFPSRIFGVIFSLIWSGIVLMLLVLNILIFQPMEIGGCRFFIENAFDMPGPGRLLFAFQSGYYLKMMGTMFLRNLFIFLWSLLLVIPGIVKAYEYRMVSYLLADCPEMSRQEAFRISRELMYGQKMNAFVLDLSFIGWNILSACTCGLLGVFYVAPYQNAANAELFLELKRQYFEGQRS